jgi:TRAP-type mannitol/chloroaromatic compound transport system permease small subunit
MSEENSSEHGYKFAYGVCAIFLIGFILVTLAVVSDALHRGELEQVVPQAVTAPSATPREQ